MNTAAYTIQEAAEPDAESITSVHVSSWQTSYAGIVEQDFLDNLSYEKRLVSWEEILKSESSQELVVMVGNKIIGFASFGPIRPESRFEEHPYFKNKEAKIGEIYAIYLLEGHKRKGLGQALFNRCRLWFNQHGLHSFVTLVLADNLPARRFYEKEGGKPVGEIMTTIGDKKYPEVCYWFETLPRPPSK